MKRLFYLLFGLVLLPALLYAQGSLSPKDINDNLTNNYYNKIASDARYATTTYGYSSAEVDILLAPKADKTYVNATDEAIISDNDSQDVQIEANRVAITLKASQTDMDSAEAKINQIDIRSESTETGLDAHIDNLLNPHQVTASQVNTSMTTEVSDTTTVLGQLIDIGQSINKQQFSGFVSWGGSGDYWQITGGAFELLRPGCGYIYGRKVNFTAPQTTGVLAANTEYYVYIDRNGVIQLTTTQSTAFNAIPLFEVFYDGTNYTVVKENHPYNFPTRASEYIHNNVGIIIRNAAGGANIDKLGTTTGASVNDRRVELLGADVLEDHGLETTIPDSTGSAIQIKYYYTNNAGKWIQYLDTTEVPMVWNNAGTITALTANRYGNFRVYVSKDNLNASTPTYFAVIGAYDHANATNAANRITAGMAAATNELAGLELAQLGYVTVHNSTGGYISTVTVEKATLRGETTGSGATNVAALVSTNAFTGTLAGALNVQAALDILDALNIQTELDSLENAIQSIIVGSGFALESWVNSTLETNFYTQVQTNATIEAAIAAIPAPSVNQTITVTAGEDLSAGDVVSLINSGGSIKAYNNPLTVSTSPNGEERVFNSAATTYCNAVALDTSRFIVVFQGAGSDPEAIVGTVSGSTISWGTKKTGIDAGTLATYLPVCKIGTDKVLIAYGDGVGSKGRMCVLTISGTTITAGTPVNFLATANATYESLTTLDTDKALLVYRAVSDTKGKAKVITVSSTTPTPYPDANTEGTEYNAGATAYNSVSALSSTSAIVAYQDGGNSSYGTAQVLSISGTTITPGTEYVFEGAGSTDYISTDKLTTSTALIGFRIGGAAKVLVAYNLSTTPNFGSAVSFSANGIYGNVKNIDGSNASFVWYYNNTTSGFVNTFSISSNSITKRTDYAFNTTGTTYYLNQCYLGSNKIVIAYQGNGSNNYGTAVVNQWATTSYASVSGLSQGAYSSGSDAVVLISGVSDDQTDLIVGSPYFLQSDFTIGTTPISLAKYYNSSTATGEIKIGTAKSATELIIGIDYK